ncbi:alpha/beta hydrolase [Nostoc favosum]|uniref:Alpha/beta hydrolase n=1 Tax=Nostoc favosum CHAB5714 TaxID=2780399 RepID=A0ABS8IHJ9_9NOSO|nr:alpha/beta hydrolase [Nostoc favosum]MCC5603253.1 alpha/beta hydrolase [Nostoc favosum CHAB5714]
MTVSEKSNQATNFSGWLRDLLMAISGLPILAAVAYGVVIAYKTYHPIRKKTTRQSGGFKLAGVPVKIPVNRSHVTLDAWFIHTTVSAHTVIIGHEVGSHKGSKLRYADFIYKAGYNVLVFDHRNHGDSSTDRAFWSMSRRFSDDIEAAISFVRSKPELAEGNIALLCFSFSTFPALYSMMRPQSQSSVRAIILDSGPTLSITQLSHRFIDAFKEFMLPSIFSGPILYPLLKTVYAMAINMMLAVKWPPKLSDLPINMLFIANEEDKIVPPDEIRQFTKLHPNSEFWLASHTPHLMAFWRHGEAYRNLIINFLSRYLTEESSQITKIKG